VDLGGNNKGKIQSINLVPPQNVDIESGGWREPIKAYKLDFNGQVALDKRFIYHVRMFPNLDYTNGKNFMGLSPVSVAANIIIAQNNGYLRLAQLLLKGAPPGILSKDTEGPFDPGQSDAQRVNMEKQWKRKYSNTENAFLPLFTTGKIAWQQIGISSMKDLQVLESSVAGMRVLCRIWGIPPQAFGDTEQSTYNNMNEAKKAVYEDRIMPDMTRRLEVFNKILGNDYYKKELRADYSEVPCMQTDLKTKAEILGMEKGQKTITVDEYREGMGRAPLDEDQRIELRVDEEPEENVLF
jgi:HK97 family phage portal protein